METVQFRWSYQARVGEWMRECFGEWIAADQVERNDRFIEEALELAQSLCWTADRAHALVDYVFGQPAGSPPQEVGGVMVTLAALCSTADIDMHDAAEAELARVWTKVEAIRAKQAAKPTGSALPVAQTANAPEPHDALGNDALVAELLAALKSLGPILEEVSEKWDEGMKSGKLLIALLDPSLRYRADISAIHAAIAKAEAQLTEKAAAIEHPAGEDSDWGWMP